MSNIKQVILATIIVILVIVVAYTLSSPADLGQVDQSIVIGVSTALSGPASLIGEDFVYGINMAQASINASGGIAGKPVELRVQDNGNNATAGIAAYKALDQQEADIIVSSMSAATVPIMSLAEAAGKPMLISFVYADVITGHDHASRYFSKVEDEALVTIRDMRKNAVNSIGVLYLKSEYGQASLDAFSIEAKKENMKILATEGFLGAGNDFMTPLQKVVSSQPDAVYIIGIRTTPIIKQVKILDPAVNIFTNGLPVNSGYIYQDPEVYNGVHLTASDVAIPGTLERESFSEKIDLQESKPHSIPHAAFGFDMLYLIKSVLEKNSNLTQFTDTFASLGTFTGATGEVHIGSRDVGVEISPVVLEDGVLSVAE